MIRYSLKTKQIQKEAILLAEHFGVDPIVGQLWLNRGLNNEKAICSYLYKELKPIVNLREAAYIIKSLVNQDQRFLVHGDYDADGITSTAIMVKALEQLGAQVKWYLPSREVGYGVNMKYLYQIKDTFDILITVDCGTNEMFLNSLGKMVIVLDHHQLVNDKLPPGVLVVNPTLNQEEMNMAAAGIAFMMAKELLGNDFFIDLAMVGTIADIVPIKNNNRYIVAEGKKKVNNFGLKSMMEMLRVQELNNFNIGFVIGPRLNAAGRMATPDKALRLFLTEQKSEVLDIVLDLNDLNQKRQTLVENIINSCQVNETDQILVVHNPEWPKGVLGLVAAKLVERYKKPCIAIGKNGTGSARSGGYVDILALIQKADKYLKSYGGHKDAAGLSIAELNIDLFRQEINKFVEYIKPVCVEVDLVLPAKSLNEKLVEQIEYCIGPFGPGNNAPLFGVGPWPVKEIIPLKNGIHTKICTEYGDVLLFNQQFQENCKFIKAIGTLDINKYNNKPQLIASKVVGAAG